MHNRLIIVLIFFEALLCFTMASNQNGYKQFDSDSKEEINSLPFTQRSKRSTFQVSHSHGQAAFTSRMPPLDWKEYWSNHKQLLGRVYWNNQSHVVIYFGQKLLHGSTWSKVYDANSDVYLVGNGTSWLFNFTSRIWTYMTETYGNFGPDPYLCLVLHQGKSGSYFRYSLENKNDNNKRNMLDLNTSYSNAWVRPNPRREELDLLTNRLAYFVDRSSQQRLNSPSVNFWGSPKHKGTAWIDIFTYDVYLNLNMTNHAERYKNSVFDKVENSTGQNIAWFRDWFYPIYKDYGGNKVLSHYFQLLGAYVPSNEGYYNYTLNIGDFVHFWSGAAGTNLRHRAQQVFGWNKTFKEMFQRSRLQFPLISNLYNVSGGSPNNDTHNANSIPNDLSKFLQDHPGIAIGVGVVIAVVVISCFVLTAYVICYKRKIKKLKTTIRALTNEEVNEFFEGDKNCKGDEDQAIVLAMPFIKDFEISRDQMILDNTKVFGTGEFASVVSGFVQLPGRDQLISVAMKVAKPNVDVVYFKAFLSEVKIMAYLGQHENIVQLLGTCTENIKNREIFIALEYCSLGSLQDYLRNNRENFEVLENTFDNSNRGLLLQTTANNSPCYTWQGNPRVSVALQTHCVSTINKIKTLDLVRWSQGIANAMVYLTEKKVIHGDLAARNVLLTENRVAKISDFGLSRQFLNYANYMKTSKLPVPWRWLAIESLKEMKFSTASDVWAFGVTMWEIFSLGELPYGAWTFDLFFPEKLISGDRLLIPAHANQCIYQLMRDCWKIQPKERPTFQQINVFLNELISKSKK